jgi:UDP-N-acetyl-D-mannosaminuronic acid transferase (WecB/TagA/CpsF family)
MKWLGTISFLTAAVLLSSNIEISRYGFFVFLFGHIILSYYFFYKDRDYAMFVQNAFFILVDFWGIYRWFIV